MAAIRGRAVRRGAGGPLGAVARAREAGSDCKKEAPTGKAMIVSLLGLSISFFAYFIAFPNPARRRFDIYLLLLAVHLIACVTYWAMSFEEAVDAYTYWRDPFNFIEKSPFESGTYFIIHVVHGMRDLFGGTFLDHFLFFQCFGMLGLAFLMRVFNEVSDSLGVEVPIYAYLVLFLPGMHFWMAMIGKDGLMLLAGAMAIWASMRLHKRVAWAVAALVIMTLVRTHVAAVAALALAMTFFFSKQTSTRVRFLMVPVALAGVVFLVTQVSTRFNVSLFDPESLSGFIEYQQSLGEKMSRTDLESLPYPLKLLSLLFRPFYFDEAGVMALAASVENTALLAIFLYVGYHWRLVYRLARSVDYVFYCVLFAGMLIPMLALVNYNIGLGLRQKMMAVPAVLVVFATIHIYKRYMKSAAPPAQVQAPRSGTPAAAVGA